MTVEVRKFETEVGPIMAEIVICDLCGLERMNDHPRGWWNLTTDVVTLGQQGSFDFHNLDCLHCALDEGKL